MNTKTNKETIEDRLHAFLKLLQSEISEFIENSSKKKSKAAKPLLIALELHIQHEGYKILKVLKNSDFEPEYQIFKTQTDSSTEEAEKNLLDAFYPLKQSSYPANPKERIENFNMSKSNLNEAVENLNKLADAKHTDFKVEITPDQSTVIKLCKIKLDTVLPSNPYSSEIKHIYALDSLQQICEALSVEDVVYILNNYVDLFDKENLKKHEQQLEANNEQ